MLVELCNVHGLSCTRIVHNYMQHIQVAAGTAAGTEKMTAGFRLRYFVQ
jgi:hypothetical protein